MTCKPQWVLDLVPTGHFLHIKNITHDRLAVKGCTVYTIDGDLVGEAHNFDKFYISSGLGGASEFILHVDSTGWSASQLYMDENPSVDWEFGEITDTSSLTKVYFGGSRAFTGKGVEYLDVSNCSSFEYAFSSCEKFTGDITKWDVSKGTGFGDFLSGATIFNRDLSGWCTTSARDPGSGFAPGSALAPEHYPVWGTCPGPRINAVDLVCFDDACKGEAASPPDLTITGDALDIEYDWTTTDLSCLIDNEDTASPTFYFNTEGEFDVTCTLSSATAVDSPRVVTSKVKVEVCTPPTIIGTAIIKGTSSPLCKDDTYTYIVEYTGDATDVTYQWNTSDGMSTIASPTNYSTQVTFRAQGNQLLSCALTSATASDSPVNAGRPLEVEDCSNITIGNAVVTGPLTACVGEKPIRQFDANYDGNATDVRYNWATSDSSAVISRPTGKETDITFNTEGTHDVACTLSSNTASDTPRVDTKQVAVTDCSSGADEIGNISIIAPYDDQFDVCKQQPIKFVCEHNGGVPVSENTYQWRITDARGNAISSSKARITFQKENACIAQFDTVDLFKLYCKVTHPTASDSPQETYIVIQNKICNTGGCQKGCPPEHFCQEGECVELLSPCDGVICPSGQVCVDGTCEEQKNIDNVIIDGPTDACFDQQSGPYIAIHDGTAEVDRCTYEWRKVSGADVVFSNPTGRSTFITFPSGGVSATIACVVSCPTSRPKDVEKRTTITGVDCAPATADEFHFYEPNTYFTSRQDTAITTRDTSELSDYEKGIGRSTPIKRTLDRKPYL